jgi:hypothetical protein
MPPADQIQTDDAPPTTSRSEEVREAEPERDEDQLVGRSVTINRPREEVYAFWRDLPNLAAVMENVERIDTIDAKRSHWVVKGPAGKTVEWDSVVTDDQPGRLIAWRSVEGTSPIPAGSNPATRRRGAERSSQPRSPTRRRAASSGSGSPSCSSASPTSRRGAT